MPALNYSIADSVRAWWDALQSVFEATDRSAPETLSPSPAPRAPAGVERAARYLVQKIARENAAVHAVSACTAELRQRSARDGRGWDVAGGVLRLQKLERRARQATAIRHEAVRELRLQLGLPEYPSAVECNGWGEAP